MATFVRIEVGGCTVRFFFNREDAEQKAALLRKGTEVHHTIYETVNGFLVRNEDSLDLIDYQGTLPDVTAYMISERMWAAVDREDNVFGYAWGRTSEEASRAFQSVNQTMNTNGINFVRVTVARGVK